MFPDIHTYIHVNLSREYSGLAITLEGNVDTYLWVMKVTAAIRCKPWDLICDLHVSNRISKNCLLYE